MIVFSFFLCGSESWHRTRTRLRSTFQLLLLFYCCGRWLGRLTAVSFADVTRVSVRLLLCVVVTVVFALAVAMEGSEGGVRVG